MRQRVTIRQLSCFVEVANAASFTMAAKRLAVAQPALTATIQKLEAELGLRLFDRSARSVELTEAGRDLLPVAERLLRDLEGAVEDMHGLAEGKRGHISVVAAPSLFGAILAPAIENFVREHPAVRLTVRDAASDEVRRRVLSRSVDFGLTSYTSEDPDILFEPLASDQLGLVCREDHPFATLREPLPWSQLRGHDLIGHTLDTSTRLQLARVPVADCISGEPQYQVSSATSLHWMLGIGGCAAIVPSLVARLPPLRHLHFRLLIEPAVRRKIGMVFRRGTELGPVAALLADHCRRIALSTMGQPDAER